MHNFLLNLSPLWTRLSLIFFSAFETKSWNQIFFIINRKGMKTLFHSGSVFMVEVEPLLFSVTNLTFFIRNALSPSLVYLLLRG